MEKISHNKALRNWTYVVLLFACLFACLLSYGNVATSQQAWLNLCVLCRGDDYDNHNL